MEVAQTYKTSCRYVTYSRFGKLCLIVKEYIVILFLKVIKKGFFNVVLKKSFFDDLQKQNDDIFYSYETDHMAQVHNLGTF